jgi:spermidine synthase
MKYSINFWNDDHYKNFEKIASHFRREQKPIEILEIGTFEGRTAFYLLDNIPNSKVTVIDPDVGLNFRNNFAEWAKDNDTSRFNWKCDYSFPSLLEEYVNGKKYDLIYIDGDHFAPTVLEDAILSWRILKEDGIILFDDFNMKVEDNYFYISHKEFETYKENGCMWIHPREGIQSFLNLYKGQYKIFIDNYQIGVQKVCEIGKLNLNHGHKDIGLFKS